MAKDVLQEVLPAPEVNEKLKRISRRRRQLVTEKLRVLNRLQADLQAVSPELLTATHDADNLWFLRFLSFRDDLRQLARLRRATIRQIPSVGAKYARIIEEWQAKATFSDEVDYVGAMIVEDARRLLELHRQIAVLDETLATLSEQSEIARRLGSIAGFGKTSIAELAGEIGTLSRFSGEASLALYVGMSPLTVQSGQSSRARAPRQVNTRCRAAMMTAVARHIGCVPQSRAYYERKREQGKTHNQAVRALGRHMVRVIWAMLRDGRDYEPRGDAA